MISREGERALLGSVDTSLLSTSTVPGDTCREAVANGDLPVLESMAMRIGEERGPVSRPGRERAGEGGMLC